MAQHNLLGKIGEEAACRYLAKNDYRLLSRNWQAGHWEIDIVADDFGELVFVEVKTRTNEDFASAESAVTLDKMDNLIAAARMYMAYYHIDQPYRFDIITVVGTEGNFNITHRKGAYSKRSVDEERKYLHKPRKRTT